MTGRNGRMRQRLWKPSDFRNPEIRRQVEQALADRGHNGREPRKRQRPKLQHQDRLPVRRDRLEIWIPGLVLQTVNTMLGSGKREFQKDAKAVSRIALRAYARGLTLWRFEVPVDVYFEQRHAQPSGNLIDADNLVVKFLLDGLTDRGLGVIRDDKPSYVRTVAKHNNPTPQPETGVLIIVQEHRDFSLA